MNKNIQNIAPIHTLEDLELQKYELRKQLNDSETKLSETWNKMFRNPADTDEFSPTQKALSIASSAAGLIDGALLGWKLYKRFGKAASFFRKKK